jgi:uncharacterized protein YkwD
MPATRRSFTRLALFTVLVAASAPIGVPARAADPALRQAVLAEVNAFRAREGLPPLRLEERLSQAALAHSADMLARGQLSHDGGDGSKPWDRVQRHGYRWRAVRENVAAGQATAAEVVAGWIASPGHRANMVARDVTEVGVGFAAAAGMMPGNVPRRFWTLKLAAPR